VNILHLSTSDTGGAGIAALRLHTAMLDASLTSNFLCLNKTSNIDHVQKYPKFYPRFYNRILTNIGFPITVTEKNFKRTNEIYDTIEPEMFSFPKTDYKIQEHLLFKEADVVIIHWVAGFLDYSTFFKNLSKKKKFFWYAHDFSCILGGFHTLFDSERFKMHPIDILEQKIKRQKRGFLATGKSLNFIGNSDFTYQKLKASGIKSDKFFHSIPLGIPKNELSKIDKLTAKKALGLEAHGFLVLIASASITSKLKGMDRLYATFEKEPELKENCEVLTLGSDVPNNGNAINFKHIGNVWSPIFKSIIFSAADVVISTSYEETFGQTILEGYACGTPAIVFDNAALPELIVKDKTGFVVKNTTELANRLKFLIENRPITTEMGDHAFNLFHKSYTSDIQLERFMQLIESSSKD